MAGQHTMYNLRHIRQDYTYTTHEVAQALGTCEHTVLRWVKEGLNPLAGTRPYLFHSSELLRFLSVRQDKRKAPCSPTEIFCLKCRCPRHALEGSITVLPQGNGAVRLAGVCQCCGTRLNKVIKGSDWGTEHPLYAYITPAPKQHDGAQQTQPACSVDKEGQLCLNLIR